MDRNFSFLEVLSAAVNKISRLQFGHKKEVYILAILLEAPVGALKPRFSADVLKDGLWRRWLLCFDRTTTWLVCGKELLKLGGCVKMRRRPTTEYRCMNRPYDFSGWRKMVFGSGRIYSLALNHDLGEKNYLSN